MSNRFRRTSGSWIRRSILLTATLAAAGCYGFQGGGGFPSDIRTLFISSFENETSQFELDQQVFRKLQERVPRALGVRPGGKEIADAMLTGRIVRYEDVAQNYRPSRTNTSRTDVLAHQVQIVVAAQIVDTKRNVVLWESSSIQGQGEWLLNTETVERGRERAIEQIVQKIIDGAQSQW
jgi:hypothetical protein